MSYKTFIEEIINARGRFGIPEGEYKERHHVTPKCLGGEDTKDNLIDLYAREHYEAHKLLAIENPDNDKLGLAYAMMAFCVSSTQERYELSALEYEQARIIFSKSRIGHEVSIEARDKIGKSHRGRKWYTNGITDVLCLNQKRKKALLMVGAILIMMLLQRKTENLKRSMVGIRMVFKMFNVEKKIA